MSPGSITRVILAAAAAICFTSCSSGPPPAPVIGEAYVGPMELRIRADLPMDSAVVDVVRHGERLEILKQRRQLFYLVRTPKGKEGWTDGRQMLTRADMDQLRALQERAREMPNQGVALTYSELRVHTLPARGAPSFLLLKENDKVEVLAQIPTPRAELPKRPLIPKAPPKPKKDAKPKKPPKYPLPPAPKAPSLPPDWLEMSKTPVSTEEVDDAAVVDEPPPAPPVPTDYWSLVRLPNGQAGWALTRALMMAIPDDVARYAEGRRIVSYFAVGEVRDGEAAQKFWLWTTSSGQPGVDFDSFRVFVWNTRKHRYETSYVERNVTGYSPVLVKEVKYPDPAQRGQMASYTGFSICMEKAGGQRVRREFAMVGALTRLAGEGTCEAQAPFETRPVAAAPTATGGEPSPTPAGAGVGASAWERARQKVKSWFVK